jgi:hypothetical protein
MLHSLHPQHQQVLNPALLRPLQPMPQHQSRQQARAGLHRQHQIPRRLPNGKGQHCKRLLHPRHLQLSHRVQLCHLPRKTTAQQLESSWPEQHSTRSRWLLSTRRQQACQHPGWRRHRQNDNLDSAHQAHDSGRHTAMCVALHLLPANDVNAIYNCAYNS